MLVHAAVLDDQCVASLPVMTLAVMHIMALALKDEEHCAIHVAMLLAVTSGRVHVEVGFNRLRDFDCLRINDFLAEVLGSALPLPIF